jgi:orotidine-5'-phosphate decarboxylase
MKVSQSLPPGLKNRDRLIVALDTPSLDVVEKLVKELKGLVEFYKIGFELFIAHGWKAVEMVEKTGACIFLDLKLHDIPTTVTKAAAVICEHEVAMFNVHTLGGLDMMRKTAEMVRQRVKAGQRKPLVLGVTILTSHSEMELKEDLGIQKSLREQVLSLARLAQKAGLDGVICSPQETAMIRKEFPKGFVIVTPGIRPSDDTKGDQKRTLSPKEAIEAGSDYIVVGRPITESIHPREKVLKILESMG